MMTVIMTLTMLALVLALAMLFWHCRFGGSEVPETAEDMLEFVGDGLTADKLNILRQSEDYDKAVRQAALAQALLKEFEQ